jgi:predicted MFS family arabinose efflux permease
LVFGIGNFAGTTFGRHLLERNLNWTLTVMPILMGLVVGALVLFGSGRLVASALVVVWGLFFGVVQVGWPTWLTRTMPEEAEIGGGIQVAVIQLAITAGAGFGGFMFDLAGARGVYTLSSAITVAAGLGAMLAFRRSLRGAAGSWTTRVIDGGVTVKGI